MKFVAKRFTIIDAVVVTTVLLVLSPLVLIPLASGCSKNTQITTMPKDYQCIAGFKFTRNGQTQIINSENGGIRCDELR